MEKTPENNSVNNPLTTNPAQNELDLGFNQVEPITVKRFAKPEVSIFTKAKNVFGKKEGNDNIQFHIRKEPTFGQPNYPNMSSANVSGDNGVRENPIPKMAATGFTDAMRNVSVNPVSSEPVIPVTDVHNETTNTMVDTEIKSEVAVELEQAKDVITPLTSSNITMNEAEIENVNVIQQHHQQNNEPFRPINEPVSIKKANMKNPENWGILQKLPLKHRRLFIVICSLLVLLISFFWLKPNSHTVEEFQVQNNNVLPIEFQPLVPDQTKPEPPVSENIEDHGALLTQVNEAEAAPTLAGNVIRLAKYLDILSKQSASAQAATVNPDPQKTNNTQAGTPSNAIVSQAQPIVNTSLDAKKTQTTNPERQAAQPARGTATKDSGTTKTLVVSQGVSLMQVFRNNNLNIADVNAMTKAPGAGNVLSSFNPGDRVQVSVNAQGRVATLRLSNGATFTRQANGTYTYSR